MAYIDFNWVTDRLAIGGFVTESEELPFDAILSMEVHAPATVRDLVHSGRVDYQWRPIIDGYCWERQDEIVQRFDDAADQLHAWLSDDKRVLVHCFAGVSRSVTAVIWYLMRYQGKTWDEALEFVQAGRTVANPNIRFEMALRVANGEDLADEWIRERIEAYARKLESAYGLPVDRQEIWNDLERQETLARLRASAA